MDVMIQAKLASHCVQQHCMTPVATKKQPPKPSGSQWQHFSLSLGFSTAQSAAAMEVPTGENEVLSYLWSNLFLRGLEITPFFERGWRAQNVLLKKSPGGFKHTKKVEAV